MFFKDTESAWLIAWFHLPLVRRWEGFGSSSLATCPWVSTVVYFHLCVWLIRWGLLLRLPWRTGFAPVRAGVEVVQLLGPQGFWQLQVLRGVGSQGSRKYSALEGDGNQCWPIRASTLAWRTPLTEKPGKPQSRVAKSQTLLKQPCMHRRKTSFACGRSAPVRAEREGGSAAWLAGTLVASVQRHGLPPPQEFWPYQSLFLSLL